MALIHNKVWFCVMSPEHAGTKCCIGFNSLGGFESGHKNRSKIEDC